MFKEWADKYKGKFDQGYEAIRADILARQKEMGILPEDTELAPINPHGEPTGITGPEGQPWPQLDFVRPWDSLDDDEKQLFIRMAEVFAGFISYTDHEIGNSSTTSRNPNSSTTRSSWSYRTTARAPKEARTAGATRTSSSTMILTRSRRTSSISMSWAEQVLQPLQHRLGMGVRHAIPLWKRFAGYEGGTTNACIVAVAEGHRRPG